MARWERVAATLLVGAAVAAASAGCSGPSGPSVAPLTSSATPSPSTTAIFASKEEATAAAKALYEKYLNAADHVAQTGGSGVGRLKSLVSTESYAYELDGANYWRDKHLHVVGSTVLKSFELQRANLRTGTITAYSCVNFAPARIISAAGKDVTPKNRPERQTYVSRFRWSGSHLLFVKDDPWSGKSIC